MAYTPELRTITVRELLEALSDADLDARVVFASDYGDYHHTQQVHGLRGEHEEMTIEPSAYSHSGWALADDDDEDDEEPTGYDERKVLVLK